MNEASVAYEFVLMWQVLFLIGVNVEGVSSDMMESENFSSDMHECGRFWPLICTSMAGFCLENA